MNVFTWGCNKYGELGFPPAKQAPGDGGAPAPPAHVDAPRAVDGHTNDAGDGDNAIQATARAVAAGAHHTLLLTGRGDVYAVGRNQEGQLGQGKGAGRRPRAAPLRVALSLAEYHVDLVACGAHASFAVTRGGRLFEWGLLWRIAGGGKDDKDDDKDNDKDAVGGDGSNLVLNDGAAAKKKRRGGNPRASELALFHPDHAPAQAQDPDGDKDGGGGKAGPKAVAKPLDHNERARQDSAEDFSRLKAPCCAQPWS